MLGSGSALTRLGSGAPGSGHEAGLRVENRWGLVGRVAESELPEPDDQPDRNRPAGRGGGSLGMDFREPLDTSHCGCLRWGGEAGAGVHLLGIFSIRRAVPQAARVLVLPLNLPAPRA